MLRPIRDMADYIFDTSLISSAQLKNRITGLFFEETGGSMSIQCISFGFKHGLPKEADLVFDVRFMPNPFYYPEYRALSGLDAPVQEFVCSQPLVPAFFNGVESMLSELIPLYLEQDKHILRVCFGCTGGRHRSVAAAEEMAKRFVQKGMNVRVYHRDISCEAADIKERFEKQP